MKTIGLIGGMSWESTLSYYQIINEECKKQLGGLHSAKCILYSVDFDEIEACQRAGEWDRCGDILGDAAKRLETAGADFLVICTNTMHKVVPQIQAYTKLPILHIADATANALLQEDIHTVGLLGTTYTMMQDFYKTRLQDKGIQVLIPNEEQRTIVNSCIFEELCLGDIKETSKQTFLRIIEDLHRQGAQGVILGCTEIGLLVKQEDTAIPLFDTTLIHAQKAIQTALQEKV